jgi:predicted metal-dependent hydrolase
VKERNRVLDNQQENSVTEIKIIRSANRKKTVSACLKNGVMKVSAPEGLSEKELQTIIRRFKESLIRKRHKKELERQQDLKAIANRLNKTYFEGKLKISVIEYSTNQNSRFGCCNLRTGKILISHRLGAMPEWVRDYVILHELAHLIVPNHGKAFQELTARYRWKERAIGYLMAKGYEKEDKDLEDL